MEFAIPLVALGGLYIASNQQKCKKESFNSGSNLPNINVPNKNYPQETPTLKHETDITSQLSVANRYDTPSVYTDKYFNPNNNLNLPGGINEYGGIKSSEQPYYSLTGEKVDGQYFQHNNMVPFFGSHLRTRHVDANSNESVLDNYQGAGSQSITKREQAPMFSPQDNYQWAHGAPNTTDFYRSRMNTGMKMSNVKPFAEEKVAPGLGLGYTTEGSGGFNSGMMARDAWMPKNVDQLRVDSKPKPGGQSSLGFEGPKGSHVSNRGFIGHLEKNRQDTTFEMGPERLFTTTGVEKGETMRQLQVDRDLRRADAAEYTGAAGYANEATYVDGEYMPSKHIDLGPVPLAIANANGRQIATESDYGIKSKVAYPNNRSANTYDDYYGIIGGTIGAVVAPILDILRPSRKENTVGTLRPYQNPGSTVSQTYVFNPADRPVTTIRETMENKQHLNVNANQRGGAYEVTDHQPIQNERLSTTDYYYAGNASAGERGREARPYDAEYRQRNNDIKSSTIQGYMVKGNMSTFNSSVNMAAKPKEGILKNVRPLNPNMPYQTASVETRGQSSNPNALYSNIQLDRNHSDILTQLQGNPYVLNHVKGI